MAAIAFATAILVFMLSWQLGNYEIMINTAVKLQTGHLQVQGRGYADHHDIWRTVRDPGPVERLLGHVPGVAAHTVRASAFALASSAERTYGSVVLGLDPREGEVSNLPLLIRRGAYLAAGDERQAVVGTILATNLRVGVGDDLVVLGQGADGSTAASVLKVKGLFSSGEDSFDRNAILIPLPTFQEMFSMGGAVHEVVVLADSLDLVPEIERQIKAGLGALPGGDGLEVLDWQRLQPGLIQAIKIDLFSGFIFYGILVVLVAFSILNTFLMVIFERTREFGIMLAIGCTPGRLTALLWIESMVMTLLGSATGIVLGTLVTSYFRVHGIFIQAALELARLYGLPERMTPKLSLVSVGVGTSLVLVVSLLTAAYPTLRIRRLHPVRAMAEGRVS
jgi:ABC-type lipoprotein release transport system permease subunit